MANFIFYISVVVCIYRIILNLNNPSRWGDGNGAMLFLGPIVGSMFLWFFLEVLYLLVQLV